MVMHLKRYFSLILIIVMLLVISSCAKGKSDLKIEMSPPDKSLTDLASVVHDETKLSEIANFKGSLNELNMKYPVECLREDGGMYRVSYLGDESVVIFLFDGSGNRLFGSTHSTAVIKI